ncbi:MAG: efflux RND transporter permease subunit, partial [Pseudomonadota bacterium]
MSTLAISQSGDILERAKTAFFDNPRLFALSVILLVVAGTTALLTMSAEEDPRITNRTAVVLTVDPGASAPRVAQLVTEPLESALKKIEEVDEIRSTSSNGLSSIRVTLDDRITKTDEAFGRVRDALDDAVTLLPPTARSPMFIDNRSGAYTVMASITWASDTSPNLVIMRRTALELQDRLQNVPGSQLVTLHGIGDEEIVASLRPNALSALGLSPTDVSRAVATADAKASAGTLDSPLYNLSVEVRGEIDTLDRLRGVPVVSGPDGSHLRLGDIATMDRAIVEPQVELATVDGQRSVIVATRLQEGLRVTGWAERVKAEITAFEAELGPGLEMEVVFDQGDYAEDRFGALFKNLITGAAIVVLILFFTLGWRAALAVSLAIPLTGLATLTILKS